jgi:hypothetical protein
MIPVSVKSKLMVKFHKAGDAGRFIVEGPDFSTGFPICLVIFIIGFA